MTIHQLRPALVRRASEQIQPQLERWIAWLRSSELLEFGATLGPVNKLEDDLTRLCDLLDTVRFQFENTDPGSASARVYDSTRDRFYQALEFVIDVRRRNHGSLEQTRQTLRLLAACRDHLYELNRQTSPTASQTLATAER